MRRTHLRTARRELNAGDRLTLSGDGPHGVMHVNFIPAGKAQFAGANKQQQRQLYRQLSQLTSFEVVDSFQEIRDKIQIQRRVMTYFGRGDRAG